MDEKLISSVFNYPELYNVTMPDYRCTDSRASAWRNISIALGMPCECFSIILNLCVLITTLMIVIYFRDAVQLGRLKTDKLI